MNGKSVSEIINLVFKAIAVAMGVAVIVLGTLGTVDVKSAVSLLGMGLAALAITTFQKG
jgi:hypothetical protein